MAAIGQPYQSAGYDNISEGELIYIGDGSEDGTKGMAEKRIEKLQSAIPDISTWDGSIRESLIETQCNLGNHRPCCGR